MKSIYKFNLSFLKLFISLTFFSTTNSNVLIFTYCYNRPDFIELQFATLKKFLVDDFQYVVFNDAPTIEMSRKIINACKKLKIRCIRIPQNIHSMPYLERPKFGRYKHCNLANVRNSNVVQWSLDRYGFFHRGILLLLDGDIFLTKKLNIVQLMKNYNIAAFFRPCSEGPPAHKCKELHPKIPAFKYIWIGLVFLNMVNLPNKRMLNFNCGVIEENIQVDAGGFTYYYLKKHPLLKLKSFNRLRTREFKPEQLKEKMRKLNFSIESQKLALRIKSFDPKFKGIEFYINDLFVHYFGGTNYYNASQAFHDEKTQIIKEFILQILQR